MLHIDIETAGDEDLTKVGVYRYAQSARITLFAWAFDDAPVQIVDLAAGEALPQTVIAALHDPAVVKAAHNANFERTMIAEVLGIPCPPEQWRCTAVLARSLGLPGDLAGAGEALGLSSDKAKLAVGKRLITLFCKPRKPTPRKPWVRTTGEHEPGKWQQFKDYCVRDVEAEREIHARLVAYDMPESEWRLWALDQEINDRGVLVSDALVTGAMAIDEKLRDTLLEEAGVLTELDNPNSREQLLQWLRGQDVELEDLTRDTVAKAVEIGVDCDKATRVLEIRQQLAKASIKKYDAIRRAVCTDLRVRGLLQFNGAGRTGRWAGRIMQPQNLPRPVSWLHSDHDEITDERYAAAIDVVSLGDYDLARAIYGADVPDLLASLIRCTLAAGPGNRLIISDFSAIEARVLAWLAGEAWRMEVFRTHGKIYEASASEMFKVPLERIKKGNPEYALRQKGKIAELALGYQGGPNALVTMGGLEMGLDEEELPEIVQLWRKANPAVTKFWREVQDAFIAATDNPGRVFSVGYVKFKCEKDWTFIRLPSGRKLAYYRPEIEGGIWFWGVNGLTKKFERCQTFGGRLVENITQAVARDCLAEALLALNAAGYRTVLHVHDEVVAEMPDGLGSLKEMNEIMGRELPWAPGLPLKGAGFETTYYRKD